MKTFSPQFRRPLVFVINSLMRGGAQRLVVDDINECLRRGIPVRLLTLEAERVGNTLASECSLSPDHWIRIPFRGLWDIHAWRCGIRTLRCLDPEAVFTHLWLSNTIGRCLCFLARVQCPVVVFEHNVYEGIKRRWQYAVDRILLCRTAVVIAVSKTVQMFLEGKGIPSSMIRVIKNGVDLQRYGSVERGVDVWRALGLSPSMPIVLFVGRLVEQKGVDILLRAFQKIRHTSAHLIIAGDGRQRLALEAFVQNMHLESRIHFLGVYSDIPSLMCSADLFVFPSRWEGLGTVLLEAMAARLPIVTSSAGAIQEIVTHEENGLIVPIAEVDLLAAAIDRLLVDTSLRARLIEGGSRIVAQYAIPVHLDALLRITGAYEGHT